MYSLNRLVKKNLWEEITLLKCLRLFKMILILVPEECLYLLFKLWLLCKPCWTEKMDDTFMITKWCFSSRIFLKRMESCSHKNGINNVHYEHVRGMVSQHAVYAVYESSSFISYNDVSFFLLVNTYTIIFAFSKNIYYKKLHIIRITSMYLSQLLLISEL